MRVVEQLIDHLRRNGYLTAAQLAELRHMGLLRDPRFEDDVPPLGTPYPDVESQTDEDVRTDALDAYGDSLIDDARRAGARKRKRIRRSDSTFVAAITKAVGEAQNFLDVVIEVAQRVDPGTDTDTAVRVVASADAANLVAALVRDSLWARLWPHVERDPVFDALAGNQRRRFSALVDAAPRADTTVPRGVGDNLAVRRAIDIVAAHRVLSSAFGRAADAVGPRRALLELDLAGNPAAYEALVLLHSAQTIWRTVAQLPDLVPDVGLPAPARLLRPCFESGWEIAARIDPVTVLPYMNWCTNAWATLSPGRIPPARAGVTIGTRTYRGAWIQPANREWFSVKDMGSKWSVLRHSHHCPNTLGDVSQTITLDGIDYAHTCPDMCRPPRMFQRTDRSETMTVTLSWSLPPDPDRETLRADYGALWTAALVEMPLLTCPKEWELT